MNIALDDFSYGYNFFYAVAIILAVFVLIIQGKIYRFQFFSWTLTFVSCLVVFVIGCTLITFKRVEWKSLLFASGVHHHHVGASVLGGLLFSIPMIILFKRLYSYNNKMFDAFALVLPIGMAVQRIGCLIAGCCYGTLSNNPWAVTYRSGHATISLHPVQLYESAGCVLIVIMILFSARFLSKPGNLFVFSGLCYASVRFVCEYFRAHEINSVQGNQLTVLSKVQYAMLAFVIVAALIIFLRESSNLKIHKKHVQAPPLHILVIHFLVLIVVIVFFSPRLRSFDVVIIFGLVSIPCTLFFWKLYKEHLMVPHFRLTVVSLLALSILLMSQQSSTSTQHYKTVRTYNSLSFGGSAQHLDLKKQVGSTSGDCGSPIYTYFNMKNATGAVSVARTWAKENNVEYTLGLNTYVSSVKEKVSGASVANNNFSFIGLNPSFVTTMKDAEVTIGLHVGNLRRIRTDLDPSKSETTIVSHSKILPQLALRIGNPKVFFVNAQIYNNPLGVIPSSPFSFGGGSGFGSKRGNYIELGHSSFSILYITSKVAIDEKVFIKPFIGFGSGLLNHLDNNQKGFTVAVQLSARFGQKERSK
jgi:prolipoprotein diacylglyceryltransferase